MDEQQLTLLTVGGIAGFTLAGLLIFGRVRRLSILISRPFRRRYRQLRKFLADCTTDRLTRLRDAGWRRVRDTLDSPAPKEGRAWDEILDQWDRLDRKLARQCAKLLDALANDEAPAPIWDKSPKWKDLTTQIDRWALKAMLISEWPRQFWEFPLPRLTLLYRFYPMMGSELLSDFTKATESDIVSEAELRFTISNQCTGRRRHIGPIKRWARYQVERSKSARRPARSFVEALDDVGLKAGMTRTDFDQMLKAMEEQLQRA